MDVIPLDATLIKGSHGRIATPPEFNPVIITGKKLHKEKLQAIDVHDVIWEGLGLQ